MPVYPAPSQFIQFLVGWRTSLQDIVTNWQTRRPGAENGWRWLWSMLSVVDIELENALQGINDWAPGSPNASPTALPLIAQSRGLIQGEAETNDNFAARLINWRTNGLATAPPATPQVWSQRGKASLLAQQIQQYLGNNPLVRVIQRIYSTTGTPMARYDTANTDGTTSIAIAAWDWDSKSGWTDDTRSYLGASPYALWQNSNTYGPAATIITDQNGFQYQTSATLGTGTSGANAPLFPLTIGASVVDNPGPNQITWTNIGVDPPFTRGFWSDFWVVVYPAEWARGATIFPLTGQLVPQIAHDAILGIIGQWKGAHTFCRAILWSYNATLFDPANPGAAGNPDGRWGNWAKDDGSGNQVVARNIVDVRYWIPRNG